MGCKATLTLPKPSFYLNIDLQVSLGFLSVRGPPAVAHFSDLLLHLDETEITSQGLKRFPLAEYTAKHWVDHVRFDNVSAITQNGIQ
jgi:hypothetical protein